MQHEVDSESVGLDVARDGCASECGDGRVSYVHDVDRVRVGGDPCSIGDRSKSSVAEADGWIVGHTVVGRKDGIVIDKDRSTDSVRFFYRRLKRVSWQDGNLWIVDEVSEVDLGKAVVFEAAVEGSGRYAVGEKFVGKSEAGAKQGKGVVGRRNTKGGEEGNRDKSGRRDA